MHRDVTDAEVAGGFEQRCGEVGAVHPPAVAPAVVEERRVELQPVDPEVVDLGLELTDRRVGDRRVDRGVEQVPAGMAVARYTN